MHNPRGGEERNRHAEHTKGAGRAYHQHRAPPQQPQNSQGGHGKAHRGGKHTNSNPWSRSAEAAHEAKHERSERRLERSTHHRQPAGRPWELNAHHQQQRTSAGQEKKPSPSKKSRKKPGPQSGTYQGGRKSTPPAYRPPTVHPGALQDTSAGQRRQHRRGHRKCAMDRKAEEQTATVNPPQNNDPHQDTHQDGTRNKKGTTTWYSPRGQKEHPKKPTAPKQTAPGAIQELAPGCEARRRHPPRPQQAPAQPRPKKHQGHQETEEAGRTSSAMQGDQERSPAEPQDPANMPLQRKK